jgi:HD-GYP domain-containing protein (c-di-GMP phosphodiesterase class II)
VSLLTSIVTSLTNPHLPLLDALERTMTVRDGSMNEHGHRVRKYALALAIEAGITDVATTDAIGAAAVLHDIGKLAIPDHILQKPGPLSRDEYELVKQHSVIGADLLGAMAMAAPMAIFVRHHHENWDGTGYPDGLRGDDIPLGARVLAIADCYDALTSDRPYRPALSHARATTLIEDQVGTMYDPHLALAFLRIIQPVHVRSARERSAVISVAAPQSWTPQASTV